MQQTCSQAYPGLHLENNSQFRIFDPLNLPLDSLGMRREGKRREGKRREAPSCSMGVGLGGDARSIVPTNILRWENSPHQYFSEIFCAAIWIEKDILHNIFAKLIRIIVRCPEKLKIHFQVNQSALEPARQDGVIYLAEVAESETLRESWDRKSVV